MTFTIRAALPGDEEQLALLMRPVHALHIAERPETFKPIVHEEITAWLREQLLSPTARTWIAESDGVPVGFLRSVIHERLPNPFSHGRRYCEIDHVSVDEPFRRRGIATALIRQAIDAAHADGITDIEIVTWAFNEPAHATYRHLGFQPRLIRWELAK